MSENEREMTFSDIDKRANPVVPQSIQKTDMQGHPSGGHVQFVANGAFQLRNDGIRDVGSIKWQDGPIDFDNGVPNGVTVEALLEACRDHLVFFNESAFKCRENSLAITKIEEAMHWLQHRREDRFRRGVLGKHEA